MGRSPESDPWGVVVATDFGGLVEEVVLEDEGEVDEVIDDPEALA